MNEFARYEALSFDCYGTLIDWEAGIGGELARWAVAHDVVATRDELIEAFAAIETDVQTRHPQMAYPDVLSRVLHRVAERFDATATAQEAAAFGASVGTWPAFADTPAALARLGERYKLIVLSNVDRRSFAASSRRLGVEFDLIVTAEDVGAYKPSPASFPALLARLESIGVTRSRLLHVAQSLYHDHEPAAAAGLPTVWIDRRHDMAGFGATPPPHGSVAPRWRFPSMAAFTAAAMGD